MARAQGQKASADVIFSLELEFCLLWRICGEDGETGCEKAGDRAVGKEGCFVQVLAGKVARKGRRPWICFQRQRLAG